MPLFMLREFLDLNRIPMPTRPKGLPLLLTHTEKSLKAVARWAFGFESRSAIVR
jgi:hypothetical protein